MKSIPIAELRTLLQDEAAEVIIKGILRQREEKRKAKLVRPHDVHVTVLLSQRLVGVLAASAEDAVASVRCNLVLPEHPDWFVEEPVYLAAPGLDTPSTPE